MIPARRHFAGHAPVTPPTSDSDSESKSESDAEPVRPAPVARRRRFVARVVEEAKLDKRTSGERLTPAKGFIPVKELERKASSQTQTAQPRQQERVQDPTRDQSPPSPVSPSSPSQSSESESERSLSPPPQPLPPPSFKPVFIKPKAKEVPDSSRQESRAQERKEEARQLVSAALKEEEDSLRIEGHIELPDDTDHERDKAREEALWRVREMRRVLREREAEKAWRNRGLIQKATDSEYDVKGNAGKNASKIGTDSEAGTGEKRITGGSKVGPFFVERCEDGRFTEDIYNRELQEGRGGLAGLRVGHDGGRSGRTKFSGLAKEDTAGEMVRELKRDRELAATLEAARRR